MLHRVAIGTTGLSRRARPRRPPTRWRCWTWCGGS